jgi:hypothetical protein
MNGDSVSQGPISPVGGKTKFIAICSEVNSFSLDWVALFKRKARPDSFMLDEGLC